MGTGKQIKRLRLRARLSAEKAAALIGVDVDRLRKWEAKDLEPRNADSRKIEAFFGIALDDLEQLESFNFFQNVPHETGGTAPESIRKPKTETDPEKEGISFIPINAIAGYPKRIIDPMFKSNLQKIFIPGMPYRGESFRIWEVEGNSMEPTFKEGYYVLTERVDPPWTKIKEHYAYVIVTELDVFLKRLKKSVTTDNAWAAISDNEELYPPFLISMEEVKELWLVKRKMDWEMSPPKRFDVNI
jgi:phage repressor protein C with HTH and peptisase S24 domain